MKKYKSSLGQSISMILIGWIFCFIWVIFEDSLGYVDLMIVMSMFVVVIFVVIINIGTYLKIENDTLTWIRTYKKEKVFI